MYKYAQYLYCLLLPFLWRASLFLFFLGGLKEGVGGNQTLKSHRGYKAQFSLQSFGFCSYVDTKAKAWITSALPAFFRMKHIFQIVRSWIKRLMICVTEDCSFQKASPFHASHRRHRTVSNTDGHSLPSRPWGGLRRHLIFLRLV